jgi:hypothetical protein
VAWSGGFGRVALRPGGEVGLCGRRSGASHPAGCASPRGGC